MSLYMPVDLLPFASVERKREKTGFDAWRLGERERGFEVLPASGMPAL
jgi:hypothetical protein